MEGRKEKDGVNLCAVSELKKERNDEP